MIHKLVIDEDGRGEYEIFEFETRTEFSSGVVRLDDEIISIDRTRLKLQNYPAPSEDAGSGKSAGNWTMRAQNLYFYRN